MTFLRNVTLQGWDMLGPLHQDQQLLLHGLPDVGDAGQPLGVDLVFRQLCAHIIALGALSDNVWLDETRSWSVLNMLPLPVC